MPYGRVNPRDWQELDIKKHGKGMQHHWSAFIVRSESDNMSVRALTCSPHSCEPLQEQ